MLLLLLLSKKHGDEDAEELSVDSIDDDDDDVTDDALASNIICFRNARRSSGVRLALLRCSCIVVFGDEDMIGTIAIFCFTGGRM